MPRHLQQVAALHQPNRHLLLLQHMPRLVQRQQHSRGWRQSQQLLDGLQLHMKATRLHLTGQPHQSSLCSISSTAGKGASQSSCYTACSAKSDVKGLLQSNVVFEKAFRSVVHCRQIAGHSSGTVSGRAAALLVTVDSMEERRSTAPSSAFCYQASCRWL